MTQFKSRVAHYLLFLTLLLSLLLSPAAFAAFTTPVTFSTPGAWSWTVPSGTTTIGVLVAGGGGAGGGYDSNGSGGNGGSGALIYFTLNVTPGQTLSGIIGQGGTGGWNAAASCQGGGGGGGGTGYAAGAGGGQASCNGGNSGSGGGGGGATNLFTN